ncbi:MAG: hypothetical protein WA945_05940 [Arcobacteraceae bacterium]
MSDTQEVENYEHNLKLYYEAKRKELDIILSNSMPTQMNNIKTLLWMNFLLIGLMFQFIKKFPIPDIVIGFFILSLCAIICVLMAILSNRTKSYGTLDSYEHISEYVNNKWTKSQFFIDMIDSVIYSIKHNRKILHNKSKLMHLSTWFTLLAILFIIIAFFQMQ